MCKEYNEHMRQYKSEFWCIKHQDGVHSSTGKINNRIKALEELGVETSNVTKADGEIMFSFEPKDLTSICSVFKIKKKIKSKMTEEQRQVARERFNEVRKHKDLTP